MAEQMKRLDDNFIDDSFSQCPPLSYLTVILISSNKQSFNLIGMLAAPYVAGSYAENSYEMTLLVAHKCAPLDGSTTIRHLR